VVVEMFLDTSLEVVLGTLVTNSESKGNVLEFAFLFGLKSTHVLDRGHNGGWKGR